MSKLVHEKLQVLALHDEPSGMIKNGIDLYQYKKERLIPLLQEWDIITVDKGIIDQSVFSTENSKFTAITSRVGNANFHTHDTVHLVANSHTKTVFSEPDVIARATWETMNNPRWEQVFAKTVARDEQKLTSWTFDIVKGFLNVGLRGDVDPSVQKYFQFFSNDIDIERYHAVPGGLNGMNSIVIAYEEHFEQADIYAFIREIQERCGQQLQAIDWKDTDIGVIRKQVHHGRDVRTQDARQSGESLYLIE